MALSKTGLKNRIISEMSDLGFNVSNSFCYVSSLAQAISWAVIDEITANAKCSGLDSNSDTHDNVAIV